MTEPLSTNPDGSDASTRSQSPPKTITELREALDRLLVAAHANGVAIDETTLVLRHVEDDISDWEVEIVELEKNSDAEE